MKSPGRVAPDVESDRKGFTLIELLVAMAVLALLMLVISSITSHTSATVRTANSKLDAFQAGRAGFEVMAQKLSQATLNTYWAYDNPNAPTKYERKSDLHFLTSPANTFLVGRNGRGTAIFFQSPEATATRTDFDQTQGLLNACGFFVEYGSDSGTADPRWHRPAFLENVTTVKPRYRYRLMQALQPADDMSVFSKNDASWARAASTTDPKVVANTVWPLADNVIALIVQPRLSLGDGTDSICSDYNYDSRNTGVTTQAKTQKAQLPPIVQLTMVVIDEASAARLESATPPAIIEQAVAGDNRFTQVANYQKDIEEMGKLLAANHIKYQVFTASVLLRESKWSSTQ